MVLFAKSITRKILTILIFNLIIICLFCNTSNADTKSVTLYLEGYDDIAAKTKTLTTTEDGKFTSAGPFIVNRAMLLNHRNVFCMNKSEAFPGDKWCYEQIFFSIEEEKIQFSMDGKIYDYVDNYNNYGMSSFQYWYNGGTTATPGDDADRNFYQDFHNGSDINNMFALNDKNGTFCGNRYKLAYIASEIPYQAPDVVAVYKAYLSESEYQWAMWILQGGANQIDSKRVNLFQTTANLLANATAYAEYINKGYINSTPSLNMNNATVDAVNKTISIPMSNYNIATATYKLNEKTGKGKYGEITKVDVIYKDANGNQKTYTASFDDTSKNLLKITVNDAVLAGNEIQVKLTLNNQYRNAYLWVLRTNNKGNVVTNTEAGFLDELLYGVLKPEESIKEIQTSQYMQGVNICSTNSQHDLKSYVHQYPCKFCEGTDASSCVCKDKDGDKLIVGNLYFFCPTCRGSEIYKSIVELNDFVGQEVTDEQNQKRIAPDELFDMHTGYRDKLTNEETSPDGRIITASHQHMETGIDACTEIEVYSYKETEMKNSFQTIYSNATSCCGIPCWMYENKNYKVASTENVPDGIPAIMAPYYTYCKECGSFGIGVNSFVKEPVTLYTNNAKKAFEGQGFEGKISFFVGGVLNCTQKCGKVFFTTAMPQINNVVEWDPPDFTSEDTSEDDFISFCKMSEDNNGWLPLNGAKYYQVGLIEYKNHWTFTKEEMLEGIQNVIVTTGEKAPSTSTSTPIQLNTNLTIKKTNAATKLPMKDIDLDFEFTGVKSVVVGNKTYSASNGIVKITNVITNSSGDIELKNISFTGSEAYVTITENIDNTKYLAWSEPLKLKLTKSNGGLTVTKVSGPDYLSLDNLHVNYKDYGYWYHTGSIKNGKDAVVNITNIPLINISGVVYLDGQSGVKDAQIPNGQKESAEEGINGIKVDLKDANGNSIKSIHTNNDGIYTFTGILAQPYYITYEYNGMKYESSINQEVSEGRDEFNATFGNFTNVSSKNAKDEETNEILDNQYTVMTARTKTVSIHDIDQDSSKFTSEPEKIQLGFVSGPGKTGQNPPISSVIGAASGVTGNYTNVNKTNSPKTDITFNDGHLTINHSYGLLKREADLALGVKVDSITVSANGKTSTEKFGTSNAEKNVDSLENRTIEYNKALAEIDYNFTMEEYKNVWGLEEFDQEKEGKGTFEQTTMNITYLVEIKNVCARDAIVSKIRIRENENLKNLERSGTINYYYSTDTGENGVYVGNNKEIDISGIGDIKATESLYLKITYMNIPKDYIVENNTFELEAEIVEYSTKGVNFSESWKTAPNMVDKDSTPGNWDTSEDDYGKATVKLTKDEKAERTISGIVFEDAKTEGPNEYKVGNGNWDAGENKLNGIVVQLIELKEVELLGTTYTLEYLWQETVTGSNVVKRINDTGTEITTYTHTGDIATGQYLFKDVLPGTYVVRFRYGEDYEDEYVNVAGGAVELEKYNGINYKSTTDKFYQEEWYKQSNYSDKSSVARDIEAKRLELMSKTVSASDVTSDKGMVAETSKINVAQSTNNLETTDTVISYDSAEKEKIEFNTIYFGLEERPATKIYLEKHITQVEIINGRNVLLNYEKGRTSQNLQVSDIATKTERGMLYFATDFEVLRGANIKMKYTYSMKNESETDYLSKELIKAYKEKTTEEYKEDLQTLAEGIKNKDISVVEDYTIGKYLGNTYYTGEVDTNTVEKVPLKVTGLRDYLDNRFKYISGGDFETVSANGKVSYVLKNPNAANGATVEYEAKSGRVKNAIESKNLAETLESGSEAITRNAVVEKTEGIDQEKDLMFIGYNAEITDYTIPTGRIGGSDQQPGNINYAYTEEDSKGPKEDDESWAETLVISKPTGIADTELTNNTKIIIISATAIAIIAAGIFAIKKFVIK